MPQNITLNINANTQNATSSINNLNRQLNTLSTSTTSLGNIFKGTFAANMVSQGISAITSGLIEAGKRMYEVTASFEKYRAVLSNSFGSQDMAIEKMNMLKDIAVKTPFELNTLTQSYIKLVNRGFTPVKSDLIKLGDLAAASGKDFDQLAEAILDAETLEFERLKEFGIKARQNVKKGEVTFTFKGIETTIKNTSENIRKYLIGLGDQMGVKGTMAVQMETLSGKMSNLGDSYDQLLLAVGNTKSGLVGGVISATTSILDSIRKSIESSNNAQAYFDKLYNNPSPGNVSIGGGRGTSDIHWSNLGKTEVEANKAYQEYLQKFNLTPMPSMGGGFAYTSDYTGVPTRDEVNKIFGEQKKIQLEKFKKTLRKKQTGYETGYENITLEEIVKAGGTSFLSKQQLEQYNYETMSKQIISETIKKGKQIVEENKKKQEDIKKTTTDKEKVSEYGGGIKQLNINIEKQVETINVYSEVDYTKVKTIITQLLTSATTDTMSHIK